jgi:iron complex transport system permease protein
VGTIGFIDLIAPHAARKIFGAKHKTVIPMSALAGGGFMVLCDIVARTVIAPTELPVGAVTALIGAPVFAYIYLRKVK